jgi:3D (Asp-Asp-Asp) domain-containing protein
MMRVTISQSLRRKIVVLVIAVVGFLFMYEAEMFDSRSAFWQSLAQSGPPRPGSQVPFAATAYCKGSTTASGVVARTGVAAADPTLLPVGSVVNIAAGDARYSGVYTVMDTGPRVQGRVLDLYMWSCHEALKFGRKEVQVTVLRLGWDPTASSPGLIDRMFRSRAARRIPAPEPPPPAGIAPDDESPSDATPATESPAPAPEAPAESAAPNPVAGQQ